MYPEFFYLMYHSTKVKINLESKLVSSVYVLASKINRITAVTHCFVDQLVHFDKS